MWKKLVKIARDLFGLKHQVKEHERRLNDLSQFVQVLFKDALQLSERLLRLELEIEHLKEQQAAEREIFRLRLENLALRYKSGLPPAEKEPPQEDREE